MPYSNMLVAFDEFLGDKPTTRPLSLMTNMFWHVGNPSKLVSLTDSIYGFSISSGFSQNAQGTV
jgi:hypothetical protein